MRQITFPQIFTFTLLAFIAIGLGHILTTLGLSFAELGEFYAPVFLLVWYLLTVVSAVAVLRVWLWLCPFEEGPIEPGSAEEVSYQVYLLFFLIFFNVFTQGSLLPTPLRRTLYLALGAKMGKGSYSAGFVLDPRFFEIGERGLIGAYAMVIPHVIEGSKLEHRRISMGDDVTIGACAVIHAGVEIGSNVIVASNAVVMKGAVIGDNQIWGGVPAKRIGELSPRNEG